MTKDNHIHEYVEPILARITNVQQDYKGSPGDTAFLIRRCKCGKGQPFEFGKTSVMQKLLKSMKGQAGGQTN